MFFHRINNIHEIFNNWLQTYKSIRQYSYPAPVIATNFTLKNYT